MMLYVEFCFSRCSVFFDSETWFHDFGVRCRAWFKNS